MEKYVGKIGIIAGSGQVPVLVAEEAIRRHPEGVGGVFALCITDDTAARLRGRIPVEKISLGQPSRAIKLLKANGVKYCVFGGKVEKGPVITGLKVDARALKILARALMKWSLAVWGIPYLPAMSSRFKQKRLRVHLM